MIEALDGLPPAVIGMRAVGTFSVEDYRAVIEPAVDGVEDPAALRLLLWLGPEFDGFGDGAWGELTGELRRMPFHRGAVVTDDVTVRTGLALLRWALHGNVRSFGNDDLDRAVEWVSS